MSGMNRTQYVLSEVKRLQSVIFDCRYQCRVKQRDQYDIDYITNRGIPVTGIEWLDVINDDMDVSRLLTINQMTEFAGKGINFWLEDPKTYATVIYKALTDYIQYYAELSDLYPNLPIPDQEDFEAMDALAKNIFRLHRCYDHELPMTGFLGRLQARRRNFKLSDFGMTKPDIVLGEDGSVQQREHKSNLELLGYRFQHRKEPDDVD